jgi:hypothetical protein
MRPTAIALLTLTTLACTPPAKPGAGQDQAAEPEATKPVLGLPEPASVEPEIVRKELLAEDLPPVPTLATFTAPVVAAGEFAFPEGTDELVPRAALELAGGLLLAGQAYHQRRPGAPPQTWRWTGFVPHEGEPRSTLHEPGAIRTATAVDGRALLTGVAGVGSDGRGWFARVDGEGGLHDSITLDNPNETELFDVLPGTASGELAIVGGYVDSQGWLASIEAGGKQRWDKYIPGPGYAQIRALARLDGGKLLGIGGLGQTFSGPWVIVAPGDGGGTQTAEDVTQTQPEVAGVDPNSLLRVLVDLGDAGYLALGTAKQNFIQAHDQVIVVGLDRQGAPAWSRVLDDLRVVEVFGARAHAGAALVVVSVPIDDGPRPATALALLSVSPGPDGEVVARRITEREGWASAGFVEGSDRPELLGHVQTAAGIQWVRLGLP